jgi:hypothetical protein
MSDTEFTDNMALRVYCIIHQMFKASSDLCHTKLLTMFYVVALSSIFIASCVGKLVNIFKYTPHIHSFQILEHI